MVEYTLPSGRVVDVSRLDDEHVVVKWTEKDIDHMLTMPIGLSKDEVDDRCNIYLYGYTDPDTGEHVPGYFELMAEDSTSTTTTDLIQ